ncbi:MAG: KilA-N domain-containing protein [Peptococcaceae bacterium]|nr:KilA-N domain-containing protein [Peptococcaceae bacterium]
MAKITKSKIEAKGIEISIQTGTDRQDYFSLTDIAKFKNPDEPRFVIQNWMRLRNSVEYLGLWETLNNPNFNRVEFEAVKSEAGTNVFALSPQKWIEATGAIGIVSKGGRYGGTYAHSDIALKFAAWLSVELELYIIKDYQRLKNDEGRRLQLEWNAKRELSKINYRIHTDAIKVHLIPENLTPQQINYTYASEADMLNVALFGKTAKQWRDENREASGNIRDEANIYQLIILVNIESMNAELIKQGMVQKDRLVFLRKMAVEQMDSLLKSTAVQSLSDTLNISMPRLPEAPKKEDEE